MKNIYVSTAVFFAVAMVSVIAFADTVTTTPSQIVDGLCANKDLITKILAWVGGIAPVASLIAWLTARYNTLPPWLQALLQVLAANFAHAIAGEPADAKARAALKKGVS